MNFNLSKYALVVNKMHETAVQKKLGTTKFGNRGLTKIQK